MLSQYDEFPVHQASRPFSHVPSTDYSWDEGYFFGVFSGDEKIFLFTGLRVNANADMVGAYAAITIDGRQYTVRLSRTWRRNMDTACGPLRYEFVEPLKRIRLTLDDNDSGLKFDIMWEGVSPAQLEAHHTVATHYRVTTEQSRYIQNGKPTGWIEFEGKRIEVTPERWACDRDHSWGLYADRKPLGGHSEWLPPHVGTTTNRALRFWTCFTAEDYSGFYQIHETATGSRDIKNDVLGSAGFEGNLYQGYDRTLELIACDHELEFAEPGSKVLKSGTIRLTDENGGIWTKRFDVAAPPWVFQPIGYSPGSWKDGGTLHTYHGNEELVLEWDEFDISKQPFSYTPYVPAGGDKELATKQMGALFGIGMTNMIAGLEYAVNFTLEGPDGQARRGQGHVEFFITGPFEPYGFK